MAIVPIEIICLGNIDISPIKNSITLLNKEQDVFIYSLLKNDECESFFEDSRKNCTTAEIYNLFDNAIPLLKGYHPFIIGVVDCRLTGKELKGNLYGAVQEDDNKQLTGKAITSIWKINAINHSIPVDVYLVFEFLSLAIRFVLGQGLIHDERRICIFDKHKIDIIEYMKKINICDSCLKRISTLLDNDQIIAIKQITSILGNICRSKDSKMAFMKQMKIIESHMPKIFLSHSSNDKKFVEQLAEDLSNNGCRVWFDKWEIKIGDNIIDKINNGISESDYLALIISKSSIKSPWVNIEWTPMFIHAIEEKKAKILPILIDDCEIPLLLRPYKYADFRHPNNHEQSFEELLNSIHIV